MSYLILCLWCVYRGSFILSRLANYHPEIFSKLAFLDVGYVSPGHGLTEQMVTFVDKSVKENMGFEVFGYFLFFNEEGAVELLDGNVSLLLTFVFTYAWGLFRWSIYENFGRNEFC